MSLHCVDKGYSSYQFPFDFSAVGAVLFFIQFIPGFESRGTPHPVHCYKTMEKTMYLWFFKCKGILIPLLKVTGPQYYRKGAWWGQRHVNYSPVDSWADGTFPHPFQD